MKDRANGRSLPGTHITIGTCVQPGFDRDPEGVALVCGGRHYTYAALDHAADRIARGLRGSGLSRGHVVGLCLPRSALMVACQLGAARAGVTYLPMDPDFPLERLRYMAIDARLDLLITSQDTVGLMEWPATWAVGEELFAPPKPDGTREASRDAQRQEAECDAAHPDDAAYLLYTSGSTGKPKGVAVPHRAVANFLISMQEEPGLSSTDTLLAVTTPSFDISVLELLLPLRCGARIVIAGERDVRDGSALRALIETHSVNVLQATSSTWRLLLEAGWRSKPGFKGLIGGEPLDPVLAARLLEAGVDLWNMYGPTETTVWSTCWRIAREELDRISLGHPIANTRLRIVDAEGRECGIGDAGEIWIGGEGLALGYPNRPEETSARFVEAGSPRERFYRTGDLGCWHPDGRLEFLGRVDQQIKIRGYRIEPREIETHLKSHSAVADAAVVATPDRSGDAALVAFIVPRGSAPNAAEIRAHLSTWLPAYMLPRHVVPVEALPLLPNGKIDRNALGARSASKATPVGRPPESTREKAVWQIWSEVLGTEHFGVDDDFFDLGGHSLLALRVINNLRDSLGVECELSVLFDHPTVAELCQAIGTLPAAEQSLSTVMALQPEGRGAPLFCLAGLHLYQALARHFTTRPVYGVYVDAEHWPMPSEDVDVNSTPSVPELAAEYRRAIMKVQPEGPYHLLGFSFGGVIAFEVARQLVAEGESVAHLTLLDSDLPGPPVARPADSVRRVLSRIRNGGVHRVLTRALGQSLERADDEAEVTGIRRIPRFAEPSPASGYDPKVYYRNVMQAYHPDPYPGTVLFIEALAAGGATHIGWDTLAPEVAVTKVDSTHLGLLDEPAVTVVATTANRHLGDSCDSPDMVHSHQA